jgi:16S rRNA (adenine1518-N6/adenine1519-N6)-dimethyltransferase
LFPFPNPKETLTEAGLRPKRSFGQNFLCDAHLVQRIADLCAPNSFAVEIGAGLGGLTTVMLNCGHRVLAIERDRDMLPVLQSRLAGAIESGQLELCEADAKSVDYAALFASHTGPCALMGNLPYNLTGPLLQRATECAKLLERAVFLVQLEVADRLTSPPAGKDYGGLSVFVQNAFNVKREFLVRRGAFYPQPNVDSAVVSMLPLPEPHHQETPIFRGLVNGAFQKRRKTLRNAWADVNSLAAEELAAAARVAGVSLDERGETLGVAQFAAMASAIESLYGTRDGSSK